MPLQKEYTFWVFMKSSSNDWKPKPIAHFKTVKEFWSVYQHLKRPSQLEAGTMINLVSVQYCPQLSPDTSPFFVEQKNPGN